MADYQLHAAHLYADLMNTYGDYGNLVALRYYAQQIGVDLDVSLVSIGDEFDDQQYDFVLFGGGQDYEEAIVAKDLPLKAAGIKRYIEADGPLLGVCGGFQLLGQYFLLADGTRIEGVGAMQHYTLNQPHNRFTGNVEIVNQETGQKYRGFENHQGRTFIADNQRPLGQVLKGKGNNGEDGGEGLIYKNVYGTYFHGPILTRNGNLALRLLEISLKRKYPAVDWSEKLKFVTPESF
ncbi:glutamine amidotransferase [Weissella diestrammenae]|uniref:Lipid II isoglutaminyl synthase (glutamine-hydrolyzing) subunit GatD n=1 Tax=Weissella diestrammenae TaxID=1162633 RepID=A0A7G9T6W3_9LACO|nr:glutamine amidotransferase [Weissella diestrammenae]MCM0582569.1 glutamine amidotransferase [Weissella diestrammenae]QNN75838.1 glutamine amidotransferase [Weissella diestrammenae]